MSELVDALRAHGVQHKGPPPRVLLPGELCKTHGYRDRRPRTAENSYLPEGR